MKQLSDESQCEVRASAAHSIDEFLEECRGFMRVRRLSLRTEKSYLTAIRRYLEFHRQKPKDMSEAAVEQFLTHLVMNRPRFGRA